MTETKVLIWFARDGGKAETMLNNWLAENLDKRILHVSQSEGGNNQASYRITYTIFYEVKS